MDRIAIVLAWRPDDDLLRLRIIDEAVEAATLGESVRAGSRRAGRAL